MRLYETCTEAVTAVCFDYIQRDHEQCYGMGERDWTVARYNNKEIQSREADR